MSAFDDALAFTLKAESGYLLDKDGETYRGILRPYHKYWPGWAIVDLKPHPIARGTIFPELEAWVADFYRTNYWDKIRGDVLPPRTARVLFDWMVNSWDDGVRALQQIVDTDRDGKLGTNTLLAMDAWMDKQLATALLVARRQFVARLSGTENQRGWNNRLNALSEEIA